MLLTGGQAQGEHQRCTQQDKGDQVNKTGRDTSAARIEGGVDWVSSTVEASSPQEVRHFLAWQHIIAAIGREGHTCKERRLLGFDGLTAGNCFTGVGERHFYLQLSGSYANDYFLQVDHEDMHYSRIDVQATVWYTEEQQDIAKEVYNGLCSVRAGNERPFRGKCYLITGSDGGDTIYIGAPTSRQRCRIYNKAKQAEVEHYNRAWRYEITLRDDLAREWAVSRRSSGIPAEEYCVKTVCAWLAQRGVRVPGLDVEHNLVMPKTRARPTDVEAKLRWLREQVAPSLKWLCELGYRDTLLEALDLPPEPSAGR